MKLVIKCFMCNTIDIYEYNIRIYDKHKRLIYESPTKDGKLVLNLKKDLYIIKVNFKNNLLCRVIYCNRKCNCINFYFERNIPITIKLVDKYYNLPIEKGELILWQNNIN